MSKKPKRADRPHIVTDIPVDMPELEAGVFDSLLTDMWSDYGLSDLPFRAQAFHMEKPDVPSERGCVLAICLGVRPIAMDDEGRAFLCGVVVKDCTIVVSVTVNDEEFTFPLDDPASLDNASLKLRSWLVEAFS